jgi:hypothetical protein
MALYTVLAVLLKTGLDCYMPCASCLQSPVASKKFLHPLAARECLFLSACWAPRGSRLHGCACWDGGTLIRVQQQALSVLFEADTTGLAASICVCIASKLFVACFITLG